jgi:hypothetical protein
MGAALMLVMYVFYVMPVKTGIQNEIYLAFRPHRSLTGCRIVVRHDELIVKCQP